MCETTISSSAPVRSRTPASARRTVPGCRRTTRAGARADRACSPRSLAQSSDGGGSGSGGRAQADERLPARRRREARLVVGVGRDDVHAEHHVGPVERAEGLNARDRSRRARTASPARSARRTRTAARARPRAARRTGSSRGSRSAPRGRARHRVHRLSRLRGSRKYASARARRRGNRPDRLRACGAAPRGRVVGARRAAEAEVDAAGKERSSVPNCSAISSGAWLGSMMPPAPTRMRRRAAADVRDHDRGRRAGDAGHVVVLGQPEAAIAPALGVPRQVERVAE